MKLLPMHDRVLVRITPPDFVGERRSQGGIILPDAPGDGAKLVNPVRVADVLQVGPGEILYDGTIRPLGVRVGQRVLVHELDVLEVEPTGDPSMPIEGLLSERSILAILMD